MAAQPPEGAPPVPPPEGAPPVPPPEVKPKWWAPYKKTVSRIFRPTYILPIFPIFGTYYAGSYCINRLIEKGAEESKNWYFHFPTTYGLSVPSIENLQETKEFSDFQTFLSDESTRFEQFSDKRKNLLISDPNCKFELLDSNRIQIYGKHGVGKSSLAAYSYFNPQFWFRVKEREFSKQPSPWLRAWISAKYSTEEDAQSAEVNKVVTATMIENELLAIAREIRKNNWKSFVKVSTLKYLPIESKTEFIPSFIKSAYKYLKGDEDWYLPGLHSFLPYVPVEKKRNIFDIQISDTKEQALLEFRSYLESHPGWLIVFDDVDVDSLDSIKHHLPSRGGTIIFTSVKDRTTKLNNNNMKKFQVTGFSESEATEFIKKNTDYDCSETDIGSILKFSSNQYSGVSNTHPTINTAKHQNNYNDDDKDNDDNNNNSNNSSNNSSNKYSPLLLSQLCGFINSKFFDDKEKIPETLEQISSQNLDGSVKTIFSDPHFGTNDTIESIKQNWPLFQLIHYLFDRKFNLNSEPGFFFERKLISAYEYFGLLLSHLAPSIMTNDLLQNSVNYLLKEGGNENEEENLSSYYQIRDHFEQLRFLKRQYPHDYHQKEKDNRDDSKIDLRENVNYNHKELGEVFTINNTTHTLMSAYLLSKLYQKRAAPQKVITRYPGQHQNKTENNEDEDEEFDLPNIIFDSIVPAVVDEVNSFQSTHLLNIFGSHLFRADKIYRNLSGIHDGTLLQKDTTRFLISKLRDNLSLYKEDNQIPIHFSDKLLNAAIDKILLSAPSTVKPRARWSFNTEKIKSLALAKYLLLDRTFVIQSSNPNSYSKVWYYLNKKNILEKKLLHMSDLSSPAAIADFVDLGSILIHLGKSIDVERDKKVYIYFGYLCSLKGNTALSENETFNRDYFRSLQSLSSAYKFFGLESEYFETQALMIDQAMDVYGNSIEAVKYLINFALSFDKIDPEAEKEYLSLVLDRIQEMQKNSNYEEIEYAHLMMDIAIRGQGLDKSIRKNFIDRSVEIYHRFSNTHKGEYIEALETYVDYLFNETNEILNLLSAILRLIAEYIELYGTPIVPQVARMAVVSSRLIDIVNEQPIDHEMDSEYFEFGLKGRRTQFLESTLLEKALFIFTALNEDGNYNIEIYKTLTDLSRIYIFSGFKDMGRKLALEAMAYAQTILPGNHPRLRDWVSMVDCVDHPFFNLAFMGPSELEEDRVETRYFQQLFRQQELDGDEEEFEDTGDLSTKIELSEDMGWPFSYPLKSNPYRIVETYDFDPLDLNFPFGMEYFEGFLPHSYSDDPEDVFTFLELDHVEEYFED